MKETGINSPLYNKENAILFLQQTIYEELESPNHNTDFEFIDNCVLAIRKLQGKEDFKTSNEDLENIWSRIKLRKINHETLSLYSLEKEQKKVVKRSFSIKKIFLVAALVALLSSLAAIVAGANGLYDSHDPYLFGELMNLFIKKDHVIDGNIEYFNQDSNEMRYYSTFEEFLKVEKIQGLYFPENLEIKRILYSESEGNKDIIFNPKDQNKYFSINANIKDDYGIDFDPSSYTKTKTEKGIDVWLHEKEAYSPGTGSTQIMFKIDEWYYCIQTSYPEDALKLIDEFKEIVP